MSFFSFPGRLFGDEKALRLYVLDAANNTRAHRRWLKKGKMRLDCSKEAIDARGKAARDELVRRGLALPTSWDEVR